MSQLATALCKPLTRPLTSAVTEGVGGVVPLRNLLTYTEQLDNAAWTKNRATITANAANDSTGAATLDKLVESTAVTNTHEANQTITLPVGQYTFSIELKAAERTKFELLLNDLVAGGCSTTADLTAGTAVVNATGSWKNATTGMVALGGGLYRYWVTGWRGAGTSLRPYARLYNGATTTYTGDGASGAYVGRAQMERGGWVTPYQRVVAGATDYDRSMGDLSGYLACWGDSLTAGAGASSFKTYPDRLGIALGRLTYNKGIGGQTSTQIAARNGASAPALLTVTGDSIPTSGSVAVTARSVSPLTAQGTQNLPGYLAGVYGLLSRDASDNYTFARAETSASATACPPASPFIAETGRSKEWINLLWLGRNNYGSPSTVKADIAACASGCSRYLVLSVLNDSSEFIGTGNYDTIVALNADLSALYGARFVDVHAYLLTKGDGGGADNTDIANGVTPTSLRSDTIHLNDTGYQHVADCVAAKLTTLGW